MATDHEFVEAVAARIGDACEVSYRKMFGEYALYSKGKVVALVCDNQLFIKATEAGRTFIGDVVEASPYPGAKHAFLIEEGLEDGAWLTRLVSLTEKELPKPKHKKKKKKTSAKKTSAKKKAAKKKKVSR